MSSLFVSETDLFRHGQTRDRITRTTTHTHIKVKEERGKHYYQWREIVPGTTIYKSDTMEITPLDRIPCSNLRGASGYRIRRRRGVAGLIRIHGGIAYTAIILLCCHVQRTLTFSIPPIASTASVTRWQQSASEPNPHRTNSCCKSSVFGSGRATSADSRRSALDATTSTEEKILQLKGQQKQVQSRKRQQHPHNKFKSKSTGYRKRHKRGRNFRRCSASQNKKRRVRHLYSKARSLEKRGLWREASGMLESILELEPKDAHSYLALGKLESRRERGNRVGRKKEAGESDGDGDGDDHGDVAKKKDARQVFQTGTAHCPASIHLWHAWAMHEQSLGDVPRARELLDKALELDPWNGYVCHAYGLLEQTEGDPQKARQLWQRGLTYQPSAALVCSLGELYTTSGHPHSARELYHAYVPKMKDGRERIEVYLAAAALEETEFGDVERARQLLVEALSGEEGGDTEQDSRAYVALVRLGTSGGLVDDFIVKKRLKQICTKQYRHARARNGGRRGAGFPVKDGRLFNAWAKLESKSNNLRGARKILRRGTRMYPRDHTLLQAAGNVEERLGNVTAARDLYSASLHLEPSAPALIAYALLELRSPEGGGGAPNVTMVRGLLDEALLIDPKHGPAYNAYGNLERREGNADRARRLYEDGIDANCTDAPSVYHGLAKLHLSLGEVGEARSVLRDGLALFDAGGGGGRNENVAFLAHTLAMIELNVNNDAKAARGALERGLRHHRYSPQLLLGMALCEGRLGNEEGARAMFERSLVADQGHAQAWQAFGVMEMQAGNFRAAKMLFECGLKNSPTHGALWQAYGTLESWKGNIGQARQLFAAGIQKCPNHVPLYQGWACLELRSGEITTAKRLIGEALTKDKRNGSGWLVAAKIEEKMDNVGLVGLILRRGIECAPGDVELYRALAEHEIKRGKIDSARELLEKGIEINPLYASLYHSLAELEARVFNIEGLARLSKRTAEIFPSDANVPPSPPSKAKRMQAWGTKIRQGRSAKIPDGIAALAEKIGVEYNDAGNAVSSIAGESLEDVDPESLLNSICGLSSEDCDGLMMFQDVPDVER